MCCRHMLHNMCCSDGNSNDMATLICGEIYQKVRSKFGQHVQVSPCDHIGGGCIVIAPTCSMTDFFNPVLAELIKFGRVML
jgi:hypothetical protein